GRIPRRDMTAFHARQIQSFENKELTELLARVWGETRATDVEKRNQIVALRATMTPAHLNSANLSAGRALYQKSCATCHVLYGQGKTVGPDLTGSNRKNLEYI